MNAGLADISESADGTLVARCKHCGYSATGKRPQRVHPCPAVVIGIRCGPGCQLRRTLSWWRLRDDGSCGCHEYAAQMDADGPDGCEARIDSIVAHLVEQAAKRSVFLGAVPSAAVVIVVRRAIDAARAEVAAATPATPPTG